MSNTRYRLEGHNQLNPPTISLRLTNSIFHSSAAALSCIAACTNNTTSWTALFRCPLATVRGRSLAAAAILLPTVAAAIVPSTVKSAVPAGPNIEPSRTGPTFTSTAPSLPTKPTSPATFFAASARAVQPGTDGPPPGYHEGQEFRPRPQRPTGSVSCLL